MSDQYTSDDLDWFTQIQQMDSDECLDAIEEAVKEGEYERVRLALEVPNLIDLYKSGSSLIFEAAYADAVDIIDLLIQKGATTDGWDDTEWVAIAKLENSDDVMEALKEFPPWEDPWEEREADGQDNGSLRTTANREQKLCPK